MLDHPVISLIDTVVNDLACRSVRTVGILASPTTIRTKLYESALAKRGIGCVLPTDGELAEIEQAIRNVIAGKPADTAALQRIAGRLRRAGAETILIGCTELSVAMANNQEQGFTDALQLLAKRLMAE